MNVQTQKKSTLSTKRFFLYASAVLLISLSLSSCNFWSCEAGQGPTLEREMEIDPASELEISIPAEVSYWLDENRSSSMVVLKAEENLLNMIDVKSDKGALTIRSESCLNSKEGIRIDIITPSLAEVLLNGNASFIAENNVTTEDLNLIVKGAGKIEMNLKAKDLDCEISGTGDIILNGTTEELDIKINGTANVEALKLAAKSVDVKVNGAGDIRVFAQEKLKVKINGAGNVQYKGKPTDIQQKINGAGDVSEIQGEENTPL